LHATQVGSEANDGLQKLLDKFSDAQYKSTLRFAVNCWTS